MTRCTFSKVDINWVLDIGSFASPQNILLRETVTKDAIAALSSAGDLCKPINTVKQARPAPTGHRISPLGTCGFSFPGHVVIRDVEKMLDSILYNNGIAEVKTIEGATHAAAAADNTAMKIYRIKGVLHAAEEDSHLYLFQGVHDIFELNESTIVPGSAEDTTDGMNKVIVIGKNLDMLMIEESFIDCMAG
jgi:hypothetical protein